MKIFTYYEDINFKNQDEMVQLWKKSWEQQGFETIILTLDDAKKSSYYEEFVTNIKQIHIDIAGHEIAPYGLSCYVRWLAYSVQKYQDSFLVSDYDVINKNFKVTEVNEKANILSFMDGYCPCFAYGSPDQFLKFCKNIISISNEHKEILQKEYQEKKFVHYHDQEFLFLNYERIACNICPARKYVRVYEHNNLEMEKYNLLHVAHQSIGISKETCPELKEINPDELRIIMTNNILNKMKTQKIFLDLGSNRLQGLQLFKNKLNIDSSWIIQGYEPNETVFNMAIEEIKIPNHINHIFSDYRNFILNNSAVSDESGKKEIKNIIQYTHDGQVREGDAGGSTLLEDVVWHQKNVKFETKIISSIDINEILEKLSLKYGDNIEIYIKCDIEGYEYKVVHRILQSKYINKIKQMFIEWHPHFFKNIQEKTNESHLLKQQLSKNNIDIFDHH